MEQRLVSGLKLTCADCLDCFSCLLLITLFSLSTPHHALATLPLPGKLWPTWPSGLLTPGLHSSSPFPLWAGVDSLAAQGSVVGHIAMWYWVTLASLSLCHILHETDECSYLIEMEALVYKSYLPCCISFCFCVGLPFMPWGSLRGGIMSYVPLSLYHFWPVSDT